MKGHSMIAFIVVLGLIACSSAMPAKKRMAYYQRNAQYYAGPKRMMYVQYVQPAERANVRRSTQAAAALVAGDTVATRTYLDDCAPGVHAHVAHSADAVNTNAGVGAATVNGEASEGVTLNFAADTSSTQHDEDLLASVGAHGATSIAEAYPAPPADEPQSDSHTIGIEVGFSAGSAAGESASVAADANPALNEVHQTAVEYEAPAVAVDTAIAAEAPEPAVVDEVPVPEPAPAYLPSDDEAKVPREYNFEVAAGSADAAPVEPAAPVTSVAAAIDTSDTAAAPEEESAPAPAPAAETPAKAEVTIKLPAPAPIAPVATPARRYFPAQKKKVFVQLEQAATDGSADEDEEHGVAVLPDAEEDDAEEDDTYLVPVAKPTRRTAIKKTGVKAKGGCVNCKAAPTPKPLPAGTFFPINFGGTSGGAIAIANAFSTGEGGSATSHAIAYGSPDAVRARVRPQASKRH